MRSAKASPLERAEFIRKTSGCKTSTEAAKALGFTYDRDPNRYRRLCSYHGVAPLKDEIDPAIVLRHKIVDHFASGLDPEQISRLINKPIRQVFEHLRNSKRFKKYIEEIDRLRHEGHASLSECHSLIICRNSQLLPSRGKASQTG
jgi:hypothetical protein